MNHYTVGEIDCSYVQTMEIQQFLNADSAASSVIGVVLLVAIAVILAAVVGTFALGIGDHAQKSQPVVALSAEQQARFLEEGSGNQDGSDNATDETNVTVVVLNYESGDNLYTGQINITVNGYPAFELRETSAMYEIAPFWDSQSAINSGSTSVVYGYDSQPGAFGVFTTNVGVQIGIADSNDGYEGQSTDVKQLSSGDTVRVIWSSESSDDSAILRQYEVK